MDEPGKEDLYSFLELEKVEAKFLKFGKSWNLESQYFFFFFGIGRIREVEFRFGSKNGILVMEDKS